MTIRSSSKINPNSWPITIRKQGTTSWPFVAGSSLDYARSHIPPTLKRLLIFERPLSFWTLCRKRLSGPSERSIPLNAVRGYASTETREAFSRARTLCLQLGSIPEYFQALFGLWGNCWMSGRNYDALRMADEFLSRSRALSDSVLLMVAYSVMGST